MKYALIGCGRIATNHVKAVVNNGLEFTAACDVLPEAIESLLAKHGLENDKTIARYSDYKTMIAEHPELRKRALKCRYVTRIALMWLFKRCAKLLRGDVSGGFLTDPSMCVGTEESSTMIRRRGAANGLPTVAASSISAFTVSTFFVG